MKLKFTAKTIPCYYGGKCNLAIPEPGEIEVTDEAEAKRLMTDFPDDFVVEKMADAMPNKAMRGKNK